MTVYAEQNAICLTAKEVFLSIIAMYITHYPCINCSKIIISSGIKTIYYKNDYKNDELVKKILSENNVYIYKI